MKNSRQFFVYSILVVIGVNFEKKFKLFFLCLTETVEESVEGFLSTQEQDELFQLMDNAATISPGLLKKNRC